MKKKYLAMLMTATIAMSTVLATVGCGADSSDAADPNASQESSTDEQSADNAGSKDDSEPVTLRFMWWGDDVRHQATLDVIEQYEKDHPNVTIEAEYGGYDGYFEKLTTQLSGGTAADIIQYNANTVSDLMAIGDVFVNLEDYKDVLDTSDFDQGFIENFSYYDGKMIALPTGINGGIWLTNTALLQEAGVDADSIKTWDDFIEAGKAVHQYNDECYLFNIDIETLGKELLAIAYGATSNVFDGYYDFKDTAIALDMPEFEDAKESGILYVPPQMLAISSKCEHPEIAADFLNYFYNNETAINTLKTCRSIPPTSQGQKICEENGYADPVIVSAVNKASETGTIHQNLYTPAEMVEILQDAVEKIAYDQGDVESITADTMNLLEETLSRLQN